MNAGSPKPEGQPAAVEAALLGLCPRCGGRTLFGGWASFAPACRQCGLDFSRFNVGDGPAAFLTMIIGAMIVALALWTEFSFHPPLWLHAVLWTPVLLGMIVAGLRMSKAALLQAEYWRDAREAGGGDAASADQPGTDQRGTGLPDEGRE
jgi:uncharacterized protein (DUF983 family)